MKWYEGTIPAAIQQAKSNRAIFIVYIQGQDDQSKAMDSTWEDRSVTDTCQQHGCVALRLQANSDVSAQFCMIYPVVCVPCTFFIGENGVPLEVTGGNVEPAAFVEKIKQVVQMHQSQLSGANATQIQQSTSQGAAQSPVTTPEGATPSETQAGAAEFSGDEASAEAGPFEPLEDKVARAKELVDMKRKEKEQKAAEEAKNKENERRQLGKDLAKLKEQQAEQERKQLAEQWKKEREEKKREKEMVKEQIARDREEKALRFKAEREERERTVEKKKQAKVETQAAEQAKQEAAKMENARLQFRLPDGSTVNNTFSSSDTLQTAWDYIQQRVRGQYGTVKLATNYPKKDFTETDLSKTLLELGLAPSAAIIVLPGSRLTVSAPSSNSGSGGGLLFMLIAPFIAIWNLLYNMFFGAPSQPRGAYNPQTGPEQTQPHSEPSTSQGARPRDRPKSSYGLRSRQQGNITRLSALQDDDDEDRTTWNGNSTQQM